MIDLLTDDSDALPGGCRVVPDESNFDDRFGDMPQWAGAGVAGGIPSRDSIPVVRTVWPSSSRADLQKIIDDAAAEAKTPVAIDLEAGVYLIDEPLRLASNIVLRGKFFDYVKLHIVMRHRWNQSWHPEPRFPAGIEGEGIHHAGIEQVTICYDESLRRPPTLRHLEKSFDDNPKRDNPCYVDSIGFRNASDCWVQGCRIIDSGSSPLSMVRCARCTARFCEIAGAHNKHGGMAYLNLSRSTQCLFTGLLVRDIRHLSIQNQEPDFPCRHNVVYHCDLEVDVNFHNGDSGHNLVEGNRIIIPSWHWWGPFAYGVRGQHQPPGPGNLLYRNHALRLRQGLLVRENPMADATKVYEMISEFGGPRQVHEPPAGGTLYAVCVCR